ncbi:MAG: cupin domain-containing protein, partial [Crocinitomicaceae bacterium]|nr:cupin domain-containing protein [Crocinitomicaceae bacterium]
MKKIIYFLFLSVPMIVFSQSEYKITSYNDKGNRAPNTHYLGDAWLNSLLQSDQELPYGITKATFRANSTLDWHFHTSAQVLIIVKGEGYYQERGKKPIRMKTGDIIKCDKETEHWHASSKEEDVTYLALYGGTQPTTWTEVLTQ